MIAAVLSSTERALIRCGAALLSADRWLQRRDADLEALSRRLSHWLARAATV